MSFFGWANRSVNSGGTGALGPVSNPSTGTLLAELDFNGTNATLLPGGQVWGVTWIVGAGTTLATLNLEHCQSTDLDMTQSTTYRRSITTQISSGQSAQFFTKHTLEVGDRLRVRVNSSFTGVANAYISAEPLV